MDAAAYVDRALAFVAHKCSFAEIDRQVERARAEYDPEETERRRLAEAEQRHAHVHLGRVSADGLVPVEAVVDLADALALEKTLAAGAARFDPTLPLDVRRAMALGQLGTETLERELVIYTHTRPDQSMVEVENTRSVVTPEQVQQWCQTSRHQGHRAPGPRPQRRA